MSTGHGSFSGLCVAKLMIQSHVVKYLYVHKLYIYASALLSSLVKVLWMQYLCTIKDRQKVRTIRLPLIPLCTENSGCSAFWWRTISLHHTCYTPECIRSGSLGHITIQPQVSLATFAKVYRSKYSLFKEQTRNTDLWEPLNILCEGPHAAPVVVVEELHYCWVHGVVRWDGAEEVGVLFLVCQNWGCCCKGQLERQKREQHSELLVCHK